MNVVETGSQLKPAYILVVEDEEEIRDLIALHLKRSGFQTTEVPNVSEAFHSFDQNRPDIICLDWMLPGLSGIEFLQMLRQRPGGSDIPVLMLTAKTEPEDIVVGLEAGADDYLTKPFEPKVLQARIKALLRRVDRFQAKGKDGKIKLGEIEIDSDSYEVRRGGEILHLTPSEYKLLTSLAANLGRVLTREALINEVQGDGVSVIGRTVDTHVFGLRKKLGEAGDMIETIRGVGYRIKAPQDKDL